jgi:hypothetical protein
LNRRVNRVQSEKNPLRKHIAEAQIEEAGGRRAPDDWRGCENSQLLASARGRPMQSRRSSVRNGRDSPPYTTKRRRGSGGPHTQADPGSTSQPLVDVRDRRPAGHCPGSRPRKAQRNLEGMRKSARGRAQSWLDEWGRLLIRPVPALLGAMTSRSPYGRDLRQNSPFSGVLSEAERAEVLGAWQRTAATNETLRPGPHTQGCHRGQ